MIKIILNIFLSVLLLISSIFAYRSWKIPIENKGYKHFIQGNDLVESGDKNKNIEEYKKALIQYEKAMEYNDDKNIKKNYEITLKKINEQKQKNKNQEDKNNKSNENQKNKDKKNQNQNNPNEKRNENNKENQKQDGKENKKNKEKIEKEEELKSILNRLEGNEKQAFKNNEKILKDSNNTNNESRW